jgi:hypothetical protein
MVILIEYMALHLHADRLAIMMMITSMGREYDAGLRPPTGLLFIPQVIYKHGEEWWNDIDRGKLIRPSEVSGIRTSKVV